MTAKEEDERALPPFDDSRKALAFALNAHDVRTPPPAMSRAMAEGVRKAQTKAAARREAKLRKQRLKEAGGDESAPDPLAGTVRRSGDARTKADAQRQWLGLARPAQAGLILREFGKLDREHRAVLAGLLTRPYESCSCGRPCCSGRYRVPRWAQAVEETCELMKESADLVRLPGKKGLGTQPGLRRAIVSLHYTKEEYVLSHLAAAAGVAAMTAAKHRAWIVEALVRIEQEAWVQIDAMLDAAGITGTIIE